MRTPHPPNPAGMELGWIEVLDLLETQARCERIESLPLNTLPDGLLDAQALGPLPGELVDRARDVLARRDEAARRFAAQLDALRQRHPQRSPSRAAHPKPAATEFWA